MRGIREEVVLEREKEAWMKQVELENNMLQRNPSHTMALFSI
jgi:hypothetical protein